MNASARTEIQPDTEQDSKQDTEQSIRPPDPFADVTDEQLARRVAAARKAEGGLLAAAVETEKCSIAAAAAFRSAPTAEAHTSAAVLAQMAVNAAEAARANALELSTVGAEIERRAKLRRVAELMPLADAEALYARWYEHLVALGTRLHATMDQEGQRLLDELAARDAAARELAPLAKEFDMDLRHTHGRLTTSVRDAASQLSQQLSAVFGQPITLGPHVTVAPFAVDAATDENGVPSLAIKAFRRLRPNSKQENSQ